MAHPAHRLPRHIPAHRVPSKLPSAKAVGTGAVAAGCLAMTLMPVAAGAKGHHGGGGPQPISGGGGATCSVPSTLVGQALDITGAGYAPNEMLQEWTVGSSYTGISFLGADASGNLAGTLGWANQVGAYTEAVKDAGSGTVMATCSFTVS